ncbi:neuroglian-like isoform X2 [Physella acuta]|uniref:neuroglian-like isoform X2 n=1 Tax=Physella acuta TaxID=109671 RepID=UPI0027DBF196|nr:neuroglian-like isoform X2 [Physella acuta]
MFLTWRFVNQPTQGTSVNMMCWTLLFGANMALTLAVTAPPKIIKQGPEDIFYKVGETVKMECVASGQPTPAYTWKRAEKDFSPEGNDERVVKQKGVGTLIINSPEDKDEGIYQCFATNDFGVAATIKFNLRMARLDEFRNQQPTTHRPYLGAHYNLTCSSPHSVPDGHVTWGVLDNGLFNPVLWDDRLTIDYDDNLHFTHVTSADARGGQPYHCMVSNPIMRKSVLGPPQYIVPQGSDEMLTDMRIAWPMSRFDELGLLNTDVKMKCIFSGNPTPSIRWRRKDNAPFSSRVVQGNSRGQELFIRDLQLEDAGVYTCVGTKEHHSTGLELSISLSVHARPSWKAKPQDVVIGEGGTANFECLASGVPKVKVSWFVNGVPLQDALRDDPRLDQRFRHVTGSKIMFEQVTKNDVMVFQCNVTNNHGYIWGEASLNVLSEAPTIVQHPQSVRVAEGQPFEMVCQITGKPDPIITWYKDDFQITGGRYVIKSSGSLYVPVAVLSDAGEYTCHAQNVKGEERSTGSVIVRRKTLIEVKPLDIEVQRGVKAKFSCSGTTDPEEISGMRTLWMKDRKPVDLGTRMFLNPQDNSLTISGTEQRDTGTYTCVVTNGLDNDTASARLVVTDFPFPPTQVSINNTCIAGQEARITWIAGTFNNAPIQYFTVEYTTSTEPNRWVFATQVTYVEATANVTLSAGVSYKFRVTAYNKVGASPPSQPSDKDCTTTPNVPTQNPRNLRTIGDIPGYLHIMWTPVPPEHHGDKNLVYRLTILRAGDPSSSAFTQIIQDWQVYEFIYASTGPPYQRYQISISARNPQGDSLEKAPTVWGYSDEGMPQLSPHSLAVLEVGPQTVLLQWNFDKSQIGKTDSRIRGQFMGFKVQFWAEGLRGETIREVDVRPKDLDLDGPADVFKASVTHMMPNTPVEARISVLNNYFVSAPSDTLKFRTPPGLPGPVQYMEEMNLADNHINLVWRPPLDNRGDLTGYDIGYQEVIDGLRLGELQDRIPPIDDPYATTAMLSGLRPSSKYRIHIWARTSAGRGEGFYIERSTTAPGAPSLPRFSIAGVGEDYINVTWWRDPYISSGSVVFVQYKKEDGPEWLSTSPDVSRDWVRLTLLQPGIRYVVRIVVTSGPVTRVSEEEDVLTDGIAKAYDLSANLGWFLAMIGSLLLHVALVIGFYVCYKRGFRFQTQEQPQTYSDVTELAGEEKSLAPVGHINQIYDGQEMYDDEGRGHYDEHSRSYGQDSYDGDSMSSDRRVSSQHDYEEYDVSHYVQPRDQVDERDESRSERDRYSDVYKSDNFDDVDIEDDENDDVNRYDDDVRDVVDKSQELSQYSKTQRDRHQDVITDRHGTDRHGSDRHGSDRHGSDRHGSDRHDTRRPAGKHPRQPGASEHTTRGAEGVDYTGTDV